MLWSSSSNIRTSSRNTNMAFLLLFIAVAISGSYCDELSDAAVSSILLFFYSCCLRSSHPQVFLVKGILKICSKFAGEHPCRSATSMKQPYWNRTSAWVLSCKFAAHFQNSFYSEHLRTVASVVCYSLSKFMLYQF